MRKRWSLDEMRGRLWTLQFHRICGTRIGPRRSRASRRVCPFSTTASSNSSHRCPQPCTNGSSGTNGTLREMARAWLPESVTTRRKGPFTIPRTCVPVPCLAPHDGFAKLPGLQDQVSRHVRLALGRGRSSQPVRGGSLNWTASKKVAPYARPMRLRVRVPPHVHGRLALLAGALRSGPRPFGGERGSPESDRPLACLRTWPVEFGRSGRDRAGTWVAKQLGVHDEPIVALCFGQTVSEFLQLPDGALLNLLEYVVRADPPASVAELAKSLGTNEMEVSAALQFFLERGWLERRRSR